MERMQLQILCITISFFFYIVVLGVLRLRQVKLHLGLRHLKLLVSHLPSVRNSDKIRMAWHDRKSEGVSRICLVAVGADVGSDVVTFLSMKLVQHVDVKGERFGITNP